MLVKGVQIKTMYKLLGIIFINECDCTIFPKNETNITSTLLVEKITLWHQRMGHTREKGLCC